MARRRKRYLDNATPADNTANVVRPVNRMIQVKQQDTPARRDKETREYQAKVERGQRIMSTFARTPAGRRASNKAYAIESQKAKQEAAKEEAAAVIGSLFKPLMPSTYVDMAVAVKNGQVNDVTDALASPYLSDSWSMRNPGKALVTDIVAPFAVGKGVQLVDRGTRGLRLARAMNKSVNLTEMPNFTQPLTPKYRTRLGSNPFEIVPNSSIQPINDSNAALTSPANWDWNRDIALFRGDKKALQQLRYLHFKAKAPNSKVQYPLWHSSEVPFNSFDLAHFGQTDSGFFGYGHYLTPYKQYAASYHPVNRSFYVNATNPSTKVDGAEFFNRDAYVKAAINKRRTLYTSYINTDNTNKLPFNLQESIKGLPKQAQIDVVNNYLKSYEARQLAKYDRYRGFFEGKDSQLHWRTLQGDIYNKVGLPSEVIIPTGQQIKSTLPITFDNNGNIIPLSLRDNFNINDIRFKYGGIIK